MTNIKYGTIIINTDGGARGNPGPAAVGVYAQADGQVLFQLSEYIGNTTNNVAEYTAVVKAIEYILANQIHSGSIKFVLDSELIVRQMLGQYKVKQPHLIKLQRQLHQLIDELKKQDLAANVLFTNVPRAENKDADRLVNQALDLQ